MIVHFFAFLTYELGRNIRLSFVSHREWAWDVSTFCFQRIDGIIDYWLHNSSLWIIRRTIMRPRVILNKIDQKRRHSIFLLVKYFVWVISSIIIMESLGIEVKILLAGSAALLVGIGFGLQPIFADLVSGLFLLFEGTVKIGDVIEADGDRWKDSSNQFKKHRGDDS